jgi:hypothetical protein
MRETIGKDDSEAPGGAESSAVVWSCWSCTEAQTVCYHDQGDMELAEALARFFNHDNPGEKQISWFLDDAEAIAGDAGPGPWEIRRLEPVNCEQAISINRLVCILREGGKDCPAYLEAVCRLPGQQEGDAA